MSEEQSRKMLVDCVNACLDGTSSAEFVVELCPHAVDAGCACRKPKPEMLLRVIRHRAEMLVEGMPSAAYFAWCDEIHGRTLYVGDLETDEQAAMAAGVQFAWAWDFFGKTREDWRQMLEALAMRDCWHATPDRDVAVDPDQTTWKCGDCDAFVDHARQPMLRRYVCEVVFDDGDENVRHVVSTALWNTKDAADNAATNAWQPSMGEVDAVVRVRDVDAGTVAVYEVTVEPDLIVSVRGPDRFSFLSREEADRMLADAKPAPAKSHADTRLDEANHRVAVLLAEIHNAAQAAGMANEVPLDGPNAIQFVREMGSAIVRLQQERDAALEDVGRLRAENEMMASELAADRELSAALD